MNLSWSHALFQVEDLDNMVNFYTEVLGFDVTNRGKLDSGAELAFLSQNASDHHQIGLVSGKQEGRPPPRGNHFAFRVDSLESVKAWHAKLEAEDRVDATRPVTHGNAWSVYFSDPEGNGIEIFCDTPWHVSQPQGGGWDPADSDESIHEQTLGAFKDDPEFEPIADYYAARAKKLGL